MNAHQTPYCILVAALGGEGGGVLADWLVQCALESGLSVQATSVPGVAQRTGATSYYVEMLRTPLAAAEGAPVFALTPLPGCVDVVVASELLEAARMVERGFVTGRTTLIASTHRVYTTIEKMHMADGRQDPQRLQAAAHALAARAVLFDMEAVTVQSGTVVSAVMFGALAGVSGAFISISQKNIPTGPMIILSLTVIVLVSLTSAAPTAEKLANITFRTLSPEKRAEWKKSITIGDWIGTIAVLAIILGGYVYFSIWLN